MTVRQKAKQLALTLVGEDQNPGPLIEALMEMAEWQRDRISKLKPMRDSPEDVQTGE